jgi:hypothetical protein
MADMKNSYKILVRKPEGKRPLGRLRYRLEDNVKMDMKDRHRIGSIGGLMQNYYFPLPKKHTK